MFYHFKRLNSGLNGVALAVMALSVIVEAVWNESVSVVALTTFATFVKGWNDFKKYARKMDMCKYGYTTFRKAMIEIDGFGFNGVDSIQLNSFVTRMITLEETITDFTPPISDELYEKYKSVGKTDKRVLQTSI